MIETRKDEIWVFAYGSLMWRPDFEYVESEPALLRGYHRAFCIYSHIYRGSPKNPGLVLGLDNGGSCVGRAFRLDPDAARDILAAIHAREMIYHVYVARRLPISLMRGRGAPRVMAHTYTADRAGPQYSGKLEPDIMINLIRNGRGTAGEARDYLANTVHHLRQLGLKDTGLAALLREVDADD
ncbi:MAG: gamma-glutamylcyclotransferase [Proteobacteria bacterium]|nr:gamma-glutamylcyclotransferase [Pseudomonadota bacterium]MDA1356486.1 gamma-glutamylcyclotransferase [Pseudomonadota bacterium]